MTNEIQHYVDMDILTKKKKKEMWLKDGRCCVRDGNEPSYILYDANENPKEKQFYDENHNLACRQKIKGPTVETSYFDEHGKLNNTYTNPAKTVVRNEIALEEEFHKHGVLSRYLGSALIKRSRAGNLQDEQSFLNGVFHSSHGPARTIYKGKSKKPIRFFVVNNKPVPLRNINILFEPALMDITLLSKYGLPDIEQRESINTQCGYCWMRYSTTQPKIKDILDETKHRGILIQCTKCLATSHYRCLLNANFNNGRCFYCQMEFNEDIKNK